EPLPVQPPRHRVQPLRGAGPGRRARDGRLRRPGRRDRAGGARRGRPPGPDPAGGLVRAGRPQPAGVRPGHRDRHPGPGVQGVLPGARGLGILAARDPVRAGRPGHPAVGAVGGQRARRRRQPGRVPLRRRPEVRHRALDQRHRARPPARGDHDRAAVGRDHGADRARGRLRRRRRPHAGRPAAGWHLAPGGRQAVHHLRRARPDREHRAPGAGPAGRRPRPGRPGDQGAVAVRGPQAPPRPRDRGADRRAERRRGHGRRAQDGHQGLHHLRAHLRRGRQAGGGLPAGRGARRHPADVPGDRARPDDGGHQGHRHPVHRLPQRPGVREDPGSGSGPDPGRGQDGPPRPHHLPPRRPPVADDAEGARRGPARAGAVHRQPAGPQRHGAGRRRVGRRGAPAQRAAAAGGQGLRIRALLGAAGHRVAADARRLGLPPRPPAGAVRPRRQDRHPLRGHHGHPGPGPLLPQDRPGPRPGARGAVRPGHRLRGVRGGERPAQGRAGSAGPGPGGRRRHRRDDGGRPLRVLGRARRRPAERLQGGAQHDPAADGARRRDLRLAAAPRRRGRPARSRRPADAARAGVLRGQGRLRALVRADGAAPAERRARHRRGHRPRRHGPRRGVVL
ncbi:MAG: Acyl-CoA dehydrogenase, partial [uncultured Friedmanniella sp.]